MTDRMPDRETRHRAVTASDANVVVTAGAGTGKTSLLIDRILHVLTRRDHRLSLTNVVALTFTKKAAREMKIRLRRRLQLMYEIASGAHGDGRAQRYEIQTIRTLQDAYEITDAELVKLSDEAMRDVERAHVGTIHSFAGHLLRLYPVEAGVDPSFEEDEGENFHDHFDGEWKQWVERELSPSGCRRDVWRQILTRYRLDDVKQLARSLTDELLPSSLSEAVTHRVVNPHVESWLQDLSARGRSLQERYSGTLAINQMLDASVILWEEALKGSALRELPVAPVLQKLVPSKKVKAWTEEDYEEAKGLIRIAQAMERARSGLSLDVLQILNPFVVQCRTSFTANGFVSFSGLLARARDLLRDHPPVRAEVKDQYRAILVDEFQDTDPVQYELILFLAEAVGTEAKEWRDVQLEPGKLFIVGDPKQSIYAFRRADIAAYDTVVQDHLLAPAARGEHHALHGNFRAHAQVLEPINGCCAKLFPGTPIKGVQPRYEPLIPASEESESFPHERVQLRLVAPPQEDADGEEEENWKTDQSSRAEAEALAQWLRNEVINKEPLLLDRQRVTVQPCHVAVLFRTLTHVRTYLETFRRHGLPCLTEGERHFFERQEVIDCIHVLRVLTNPQDRLAAVGVLRSPYGGCSDVEVEAIVRQGFLEKGAEAASLPPVFSVLRSLRETVHALPVSEAVNRTFEEVPLAELAAAAIDGEQALANVYKLRDTILSMAGQSGMALREITRQLVHWVDDPPDQAERSLIEEDHHAQASGGAIRLLSIHKAKGLEFPMVIVAGLHHDVDPRKEPVRAYHDWLTNTVGLRVRHDANLEHVFIESKLEERQRAERLRLLYVAMTRAQRRLVLSAGVPRKGAIRKGSLLSLLVQGWDLDVAPLIETKKQTSHARLVNDVPVDVTVVPAHRVGRRHVQPAQSRLRPAPPDRSEDQREWAEWMNRMKETRESPLFLLPKRVSPSPPGHVRGRLRHSPARKKGMKRNVPNDQRPSRVSPRKAHEVSTLPDRQAVFGTLAHQVLQDWDFSADPATLAVRIEHYCRAYLTGGREADVQSLCEELQDVFRHFVESEPYVVLRQAEILGREVPFAVPWDRARDQAGSVSDQSPAASSCVMEGVIDVIYRRDRQIWLADYKTHHVDETSLDRLVQEHRTTVQIYQKGAAFALGNVPIRTQLIFLRSGRSVEV